jgi:hypothetical protein
MHSLSEHQVSMSAHIHDLYPLSPIGMSGLVGPRASLVGVKKRKFCPSKDSNQDSLARFVGYFTTFPLSRLPYILPNVRMIDESERIWKKMVVT